jgi:glucose-6-phosphate 1-dehydrogenase
MPLHRPEQAELGISSTGGLQLIHGTHATICAISEAHDRLRVDCMRGAPTLFARSDAGEQAWSCMTQILEEWNEEGTARPVDQPESDNASKKANELLTRDGRRRGDLDHG